MCGIAGIAGGAPPDAALLERMAATMTHRGPDGQGTWSDGVAGLAFRRLAIIDLDERSSQPLHFERWHMVFNGEIYNYLELREELISLGHRFRTEGDGEVLLHAWAQWDEGALDRLNGMFAFAIWDDASQVLTLARDPFGEKPLYYACAGERLIFASDIPAILCEGTAGTAPRGAAVEDYLTRGGYPGFGESFYADIQVVPAAHLLRWKTGGSELARYWAPRAVPVPGRYEDAVGELSGLLRDSVRLRLRSDVPVGTSLSGGVDSSAVVALAASLSSDSRRHAFTARFKGFERDEWRYAAEVAEAAGVVEHHAVEPAAEDLLEDLDKMFALHQEPVVSSSIYAQWRVMQAARAAGVVVMLDGQGGDELFGGYQGMAAYAARSEGFDGLLEVLHRPHLGGEVARTLAAERLPRTAARAYRRRLSSPYAAPRMTAAMVEREPQYLDWMHASTPLRRELLLQCFVTSLPQLLRYADRSSMAHSREVRLPLLDRRIADFALSLPASFLNSGGVSKRVLRDAVAGLVPADVLARRDKIGFETPQASWLDMPAAHERIGATLLAPAARDRDAYDTAAIESDLRSGTWRDSNAIWRALNLECWLLASERTPASAAPVGVN
jgi:asparagine synthase (glutamine-hydrolysing)